MKIAIRKENNGLIYIDKNIYNDEKFLGIDLALPPYNYKQIEINEIYNDCEGRDFNDDLTFSIEKYTARKEKEKNNSRIIELKENLSKSDYKAIKFAEGQLSTEEYEPIKLQRQAWRAEINLLEGN